MIAVFIVGSIVGLYGAHQKWSLTRVALVAGIFGIVLGVYNARASALGIKVLRDNTAHINVGTGFIYAGKRGKYLVTNFHVCNVSNYRGKMHGSFNDGSSATGMIVRSDPRYDLCASLVETTHKGLLLAPRLAPFEEIDTRGYPEHVPSESHGQFLGKTNWTYMYTISDIGTCFKGSRKVYDDQNHLAGCEVDFNSNVSNLYSRPGSSGSPVVNQEGLLVGVVSSWAHDRDDSAGMVTFEQLSEFLKDL